MKLIGLEEHFVFPDIIKAWEKLGQDNWDLSFKASSEGEAGRKLLDFGEERILSMENTGIDIQVLSLTSPGVQNLKLDDAIALQEVSNNLLKETIRQNPDHYQGFATLATSAPQKAAYELERAVFKLGLNGAMLFGRTGEKNLSDPFFLPIFEAASEMNIPLYIHPQSPLSPIQNIYYNGFTSKLDSAFSTFGIGWHYETGVQLIRLIMSGVFDRFPTLKIITGHWGELVMFYLDRIDKLSRIAKLERTISEYFKTNIFITPSGMFSHRYLQWAVEIIGVENILFSTDYPFESTPNNGSRNFLENSNLSENDRGKIANGNWDKLCSLIKRT